MHDPHDYILGRHTGGVWRHWTLMREAGGLAWLTLDCVGRSANMLSVDVMAELAQVLDTLDREPPTALVIQSSKPAGFIAGADVSEFGGLDGPDAARELVRGGWDLFGRLAGVRYPTLALIHGHCLGGGLELALACRYRVLQEDSDVRLGLPEVMLGIVPAWGGMYRLPRQIGPMVALDMMLTGRTLTARRALAVGLVDAVAPLRLRDATARGLVLSPRAPRRASAWLRLLNMAPLSRLVARQARRRVQERDPHGLYPAPLAILDIWENHGGNALRAPEQLQRILGSDVTANLLRVFRLRERLKNQGRSGDGGHIQHVHVVGAGVMGGDIAAWCALRGLRVTLQDASLERAATAIGRAHVLFQRKAESRLAARAAGDRLQLDREGHGAARADLVIEAIVEDVEAKRTLYRDLERVMRPDALLATNTSSLSLAELSSMLLRPERFVGIHFFNPVAKMPLVEVAAVPEGKAAQRAACAFVVQIGKLPLPVADTPGFLVNAVLAPYMLEAMRCVDEGQPPEAVDAAMIAYGMPMGPLELADTVGLDIARAAGRQLVADVEEPACLRRHVDRGDLGRKTGQGFYAWRNGKPLKSAKLASQVQPGLAQRLLEPLEDATRRQLRRGVVADADLADAGLVFGAGYAPLRGGPLQGHR